MNCDLAECVGLWLAEGNNKCRNEITFTNNCFELVAHFHRNLKKFLKKYPYNPRIYTYSAGKIPPFVFDDCIIKYYEDHRARKPYYIYRIASVRLHTIWKLVVHEIQEKPEYYPDILRGFFAGEGNIRSSSRQKSIRVSQKDRYLFLEKILKYLGLLVKFRKNDRAYYIYG